MRVSGEEQAQPVLVELQGPLAVIRLNRPHERNALSISTLVELDTTFSELTRRENLKAIIFTGTKDVFASGANIRELEALTPATAGEFTERGQSLFQKIANARQLTVAAINGYCMGGGLDLALACNIRCASHTAVLAHPGARLGVITGWGGTQRLTRLIGAARALEMFATGKRLTASDALACGLVTHLHEDALTCALEIASRKI
ncbi:MAG: enoyl-CoA hydratase/isomerase family protein [Pyrinomonadaceae bacterium]